MALDSSVLSGSPLILTLQGLLWSSMSANLTCLQPGIMLSKFVAVSSHVSLQCANLAFDLTDFLLLQCKVHSNACHLTLKLVEACIKTSKKSVQADNAGDYVPQAAVYAGQPR
ncbi:hypothetical protein ATANTOWER_030484 [Ataeniobius toweri]|uniref:Uncharacterized protein n=1 Tax=Ataeniobius toweri TaxID=208326 RepID=A0ABU7AID5_9TELE|nr:hypothetical protein [Ataeniobius toweri]